MIYLDASVILPLLISDPQTERAAAWYSRLKATVIISDLANLEVSAVVSRCLRTGRLNAAEAEQALSDFDVLHMESERFTHGPEDFRLAEKFVRDFATKLAAADALHLASARNAAAELATLDARLAAAAGLSGCAVRDLA